jgi:MFS family permease
VTSPPGSARLGANFRRLFAATAGSNLGDGVAFVALPWLATTLTRDPVLVAGLPLAMLLPWFVVTIPAGALIDRTDRRRLMARVAMFRFVIATTLVLVLVSGVLTLPLLYAYALMMGGGEVLFDSASQAILPDIVERDQLSKANGHIWSGQMLAGDLLGRPLGGLLTSAGGVVPFVFQSAAVGLAAGGMMRVRGTFTADRPVERGMASLVADIKVGVRWLAGNKTLRTLALVVGALNFAHAASTATFVLFAQEILGLSPEGFGVLLSMGAIGGLLGGQVARRAGRRFGIGGALYLSLVGSLVTSVGIAVASSFVVVGALLALSGFVAVVWNVLTVTLRQEVVASGMLGRVNSAYRFLGRGLLPVGSLVAGVLVSVVEPLMGRQAGLRSPFVLATVVYVVLLFVAARQLGNARIDALVRH